MKTNGSGMSQDKGKSKKRVVQKYNMDDVDDIWGSVISDQSSDIDEEQDGLDNLLYGDSYQDTSLEDKQAIAGVDEQLAGDTFPYDDNYSDNVFKDQLDLDTVAEDVEGSDGAIDDEIRAASAVGGEQASEESEQCSSGADEFSVVLNFAAGMRQEVSRARLFQPHENTILLMDEGTDDELVVFFEQLACVQISGLPAGISAQQQESSVQETIETVDGKIYRVLVSPKQDLPGFLVCYSTEDQEHFPVTLFSKANIKKRCQDQPVVDILVEKRFVSKSILQRALQEFAQIQSMTIEKIVAQKARIPLAEIEKALENAKQNQMLGLQTGEILLISGIANEEQILEALEYHEHIKSLEIEQYLIDKGIVKETEVYICLAEKHRIPFIDLRQKKIPKESLALLPESMIVHHEILPLVKKDDVLLVATHSVDTTRLNESIVKAAGCKRVQYVLSSPAQIRKVISLICDNSK